MNGPHRLLPWDTATSRVARFHDQSGMTFYTTVFIWARPDGVGKGEEQNGNHTALVDSITFAKVQEVLAKHDHYKKRTQRHDHLLHGLLYSLDANGPCLVTVQPSKRISYY